MNDFREPQHPAGPPPAGPAEPGFFGWLRGLGLARSEERWIGGVAGGLAERTKLDPLIFRGLFLVLTIFGGPGILLYLVGWLFLPDRSGKIQAQELLRGRGNTVAYVALAIGAAIFVLPALFRGVFGFSGWGFGLGFGFGDDSFLPGWMRVLLGIAWTLVIIGLGVWLIVAIVNRKSRPGNGPGTHGAPGGPGAPGTPGYSAQQPFVAPAAPQATWTPAPPAAPAPDTDPAAPSSFAPSQHGTATSASSAAPTTPLPEGVSPLAPPAANTRLFGDQVSDQANRFAEQVSAGATQFADQATEAANRVAQEATDWSQQVAEKHQRRTLDAGHTVITLGVGLVLGALSALAVATAGYASYALVAGITVALGVLGLSIIIAGVRGRTSGWLGFASVVAICTLLVTTVFPAGTQFSLIGSRGDVFSAQTLAESPNRVVAVGNARVDLSELDRPGADLGGEINLWLGAGNGTVALPERVPVRVNVYGLAGRIGTDLDHDERTIGGPFIAHTASNTPGRATSLPTTVVNVWFLGGNVDLVQGDDFFDTEDF